MIGVSTEAVDVAGAFASEVATELALDAAAVALLELGPTRASGLFVSPVGEVHAVRVESASASEVERMG